VATVGNGFEGGLGNGGRKGVCDPQDDRLTGDRLREAMLRLNLGRSIVYRLVHRFR
jgi:hypothetical protein